MTILTPAVETEMDAFFSWSFEQQTPVAIRYPKAACPTETEAFNLPPVPGRGIFLKRNGAEILLVMCSGGLYPQVKAASEQLQHENIFADIYHLRFIKPIDKEYFIEAVSPYNVLLLVEEGAKIGGIASELEAEVLKAFPTKCTKVLAFDDAFLKQGSRQEILAQAGLSASQIAHAVKDCVARTIKD